MSQNNWNPPWPWRHLWTPLRRYVYLAESPSLSKISFVRRFASIKTSSLFVTSQVRIPQNFGLHESEMISRSKLLPHIEFLMNCDSLNLTKVRNKNIILDMFGGQTIIKWKFNVFEKVFEVFSSLLNETGKWFCHNCLFCPRRYRVSSWSPSIESHHIRTTDWKRLDTQGYGVIFR